MKLEQKVTSFDLSKTLSMKTGGYFADSIFIWRKYSLKEEPMLILRPPKGMEMGILSGELEFECAAPIASEIKEKLPPNLGGKIKWVCQKIAIVGGTQHDEYETIVEQYTHCGDTDRVYQKFDKTEADALARLLIFVTEKELS